jgi:repressor LexA
MSKGFSPLGMGGSWSQPHIGDDVRLRILRTVEDGWRTDGRSPTYREIRATTGLRALSHVKYHVDELVAEGLLRRLPGSRGLLPVRPAGLQILGTIAAGDPLDLFEEGEFEVLRLPDQPGAPSGHGLSHQRDTYALRVRGDSMVEDGILDGDYVLIAPSPVVQGTIAVAAHHTANGGRGEATLKWLYVYEDEVHLRPANPAYATRVIAREDWDREWSVQGKLVGVYRRYEA